jgi:hypothetical protein
MALCRAEADLLASAVLARKAQSVRVRRGGFRQARESSCRIARFRRASTQAVAPVRARLLIEVAKCGLG